jgi:lipopolysaccharide transport system permease protein
VRTVSAARRVERNRDLVRELLLRNVRLRYRRSVLGVAWSQLAPLGLVVVLSLVFMRVIPLGIENYPVFLFVGLTSWQWFQGGINSATTSVIANRDLVRQPGFPLRLLPAIEVGSHLVQYVLALPVLLGAVFVATGRIPLTAIALPVVVGIQLLLCLGPGYVLATAHVRVRDTSQVVGIVMRLLFYGTPIMYDADRLIGTPLQFLYDFNPLAHVIQAQRDVLLHGRWPEPGPLVVICVISGALTLAGMRLFDAVAPDFVDEI